MAATEAQIGYGATLGFAALTVPGEIADLRISGQGSAAVEATHHSSPSRYREYIKGLHEGGTLSVQIQVDAASLTPPLGSTAATDTVTLTAPVKTGGSTAWDVQFPGFFTAWDPDLPVGEKMMVSAEIKVAGAPTFTEGT